MGGEGKAAAGKVTVVDCWPSRFGTRCRIALALKGVEHDYIEENLSNKSDLLLQMNPIHKKIPVLIHDGKPVCESAIILQYIDETWSDKYPLLPSEPYQRAQARFWADYVDKKFYVPGWKHWKVRTTEEVQEVIDSLKLLEGELGDKPFFGGEKLGFVDIAVIPFYTWFYAYEKWGSFSIEAECPKLMVWIERCLEIESVSKSLADPHKVYRSVLQHKKAQGIE